jgi:transposase
MERSRGGLANKIQAVVDSNGLPVQPELSSGEARLFDLPKDIRSRKQIVKPVFGQIKQARGFRQFLLRGVGQVRAK